MRKGLTWLLLLSEDYGDRVLGTPKKDKLLINMNEQEIKSIRGNMNDNKFRPEIFNPLKSGYMRNYNFAGSLKSMLFFVEKSFLSIDISSSVILRRFSLSSWLAKLVQILH